MHKCFVIFLILISFIFNATASEDCQHSDPNTFVNAIMADMKSSPKEVNDCIVKNLEYIQRYATVKYTKNAVIIIPNDLNKKVEVLKFKNLSESKEQRWGQEKLFIKNSFFNTNNWETQSGRKKLRKDPEVMALLESYKLKGRRINWSRKIDSAYIDESACKKKQCDDGYKYDSVTCDCVAKGCSERKLEKEKTKCDDLNKANTNLKEENEGFFRSFVQFDYSFDENTCKCTKTPNKDFIPGFDPDGRLKCTKDPVKLLEKLAKCSAKNDTKTKKFFEFNVDKCKCESTKKLCKGKYWDISKNEDNLAIYEDEKKACEENPTNKWVNCECKDSLGKNQCVYKEVRKPVGSFDKNEMVYDYLHDHFDNETDKVRREFGPCAMDDWLESIEQPGRVKHCADREKFKIKGKDYKQGKGKKFKTSRTFCIKCKEGYEEERKIIAIDGINDDKKDDIGSFEEPAYSYVTKCVKKPPGKCERPAEKRRHERCIAKNKKDTFFKRGISFIWDEEKCKCEKQKPEKTQVPKTCMDKISQRKIDNCADKNGTINEQTCKCDAPCYEMISDTDQRESGQYTCQYTPSGINENNIEALLGDIAEVSVENCPNMVLKDKKVPNIEELRSKCRDHLINANEPDASSNSLSETIKVKISQNVECNLNISSGKTGFADKIPGLVGGLDLEKDFTFNGKKINDPENLDCSKGELRYKPKNVTSSEGKYKSKLTKDQCQNVVDMYKDIKSKASEFVNSVMDLKDINNDEKILLLQENFSANVTATANRVPHGSGYATHEQLSDKRANSMMEFYTKQVANHPSIPEDKRQSFLDAIKTKPQKDNIPYFGPQYASKNISIKSMRKVAGPADKGCKELLTEVSSKDMVVRRSQANADQQLLIRDYYDCTLQYHVGTELKQLEKTPAGKNFAQSIKENSVFKEFLEEKGIYDGFDIYSAPDRYLEFLSTLYDMDTQTQRKFLDSMKIFDIDVTSNFDMNKNKVVEADVEVKCTVPIDELYKEEPIMEDFTVSYGRRPGFFERFSKKCQDSFEQMIEKEMDRIEGDHQDLKEELKERFPDSYEKRFRKKLRRMALKNWRDAKYNTRQITKEEGGRRHWNQFDGNHSEDDGRTNHTQSYEQAKEKISPIDNWDPELYRYREQKY